MSDAVIYCPICSRHIVAVNAADVESGEDHSHVFVHDDITHGDDDIFALSMGVQ